MSTLSVPYKHEQLKDYLLSQIASGVYASGSVIASEVSLSRQFGISRNTVRQALKSLEDAGYLYSIRGKGTFVKSASPRESHKIALLIYDTAYMTHPVTAHLICGIDSWLQEQGYYLDVLASKRSFGEEQISQMLESYAGFLIGAYQIDPMILQSLEQSGRPFLFAKNYLQSHEQLAVRIDYSRGGYQVAEHLIQRGCVDLGLIYAGEDIAISADFGRGVRDACLEYGVRLRQKHVVVNDYASSLDTSFLDSWGKDMPDGIVCHTDEQAIAVCQALVQHGVQVPQQVQVTGCNHSQLIPAGVSSLTTLDISTHDLGIMAARRLVSMIRGESVALDAMLEPVLIKGMSTLESPIGSAK